VVGAHRQRADHLHDADVPVGAARQQIRDSCDGRAPRYSQRRFGQQVGNEILRRCPRNRVFGREGALVHHEGLVQAPRFGESGGQSAIDGKRVVDADLDDAEL